MYKIRFYRLANGESPVREYLKSLAAKRDKNSRVKFHKIRDCIRVLSTQGRGAGQPYMKHIEGDIWELRPLRDRFFFVAWEKDNFILLHQFMKQTQKTPKKELDIATRRYEDIKNGGDNIE
jgi:phage-related protein